MEAEEFLQKELNKGEVFKGASTIDGRFTGTVYLNKLVELIEKYANQSREEGSGKLPLSELKDLLVEINQLIAGWNATEAQWSEWDKQVQAKIYQLQLKIDEKSEVKFG